MMNSLGGNLEEFRLKWNDHHNSFFSIMQDLFSTEMLTDVTLACGGEVFETHKLMLCVCSTLATWSQAAARCLRRPCPALS